MKRIRIILSLTALILHPTYSFAVEPGWLEAFSISKPQLRGNKLQVPSDGSDVGSYLPKLYSGYGGVQVAQTKDYEKILMPNGTFIIRPKNTDYHN